MAANLHGVWAKWERGVEQLAALDKEVTAFCAQPHPYTIHVHQNREQGRYRFKIYPAWQPGVPWRWGAIIGEIVHDFRSALDNLVCQLVALSGGRPDVGHAFPVLAREPSQGFAAHTRRQWTDARGRRRHGPLFGLSDQAVAIIEASQPFKLADGALLQRLHSLWNLDKHRDLAPVHVIAPQALLTPRDLVPATREDRFEDSVYVVELTVPPGTDVDVEPQRPTDVTLGEGTPVVLELKHMGQLIIVGLLLPAGELFGGLLGVGLPHVQHDFGP